MNRRINPSRLSLARRRRGLTKTALAKRLGVELRTITAWEGEEFEPSDDNLRALAIDAKEVDAFSMWHGETPFVFLNTKKSCERSRFDAAHELGHLVLHRHGVPQGQQAEAEANAFASAFLMPRASVLAMAPRFAN